MRKYKVIISGGGTGGHIYPAIAIADEISRQYPGSECLFVGANRKMEMQKVPEAGYNIIGLPIRGLQRKWKWSHLLLPFQILISLIKSYVILQKFRPDMVIGTGGYAGMAVVYVSALRKIPCFIQEQNSYPGLTNKILGKKASKIFVAYKNAFTYFPKGKVIQTGNPIRQNIIQTDENRISARQEFGIKDNQKTMLILGGSLGARAINELVANKLNYLKSHNLHLIWQCGELYIDRYQSLQEDHIQIVPFIKKMDKAYAAADIIISRAGAIAISELCMVGKPTILIPSPLVAEDHQTKNAQVLSNKQAAILIQENALDDFENQCDRLLTSPTLADTLSTNIKKIATPNASKEIIHHMTSYIG